MHWRSEIRDQDGAGGVGVSLRWAGSVETQDASRARFPGPTFSAFMPLSWVPVLWDTDGGPAHLPSLALAQPHLETHLLPTPSPFFLCPVL